MARKLNTVIDATNAISHHRKPLVAVAKRHGMPAIAVLMATPVDVCVERQGPRPANRAVPEDTVRAQHKAALHSRQSLREEGFDDVVFADSLYRLEPYLERLSETRNADLGRDGNEGLGDLLLVRRLFGPEILPLWRWKPGSDVAGGDRVAEVRLGQQCLTLALRTDVDGEGDIGRPSTVSPSRPRCGAPRRAPSDQRVRHGRAASVPWLPGTTEDVTFELNGIGHTFPAGHRIRLAVSSAY